MFGRNRYRSAFIGTEAFKPLPSGEKDKLPASPWLREQMKQGKVIRCCQRKAWITKLECMRLRKESRKKLFDYCNDCPLGRTK
jgi:hypothetical protein